MAAGGSRADHACETAGPEARLSPKPLTAISSRLPLWAAAGIPTTIRACAARVCHWLPAPAARASTAQSRPGRAGAGSDFFQKAFRTLPSAYRRLPKRCNFLPKIAIPYPELGLIKDLRAEVRKKRQRRRRSLSRARASFRGDPASGWGWRFDRIGQGGGLRCGGGRTKIERTPEFGKKLLFRLSALSGARGPQASSSSARASRAWAITPRSPRRRQAAGADHAAKEAGLDGALGAPKFDRVVHSVLPNHHIP